MAATRKHLLESEELQQLPALEELKVRVVRLSELGAALTSLQSEPAAETAAQRAQPVATPDGAALPASPPAPAAAQPTLRQTPAPTPPAVARPAARAADAPEPQRTARPAPAPAAAAHAAVATAATPEPQRLITSGRLWFVLVTLLLYLGWRTPTERYITPNRGLGYALGIIGGSLMLLLLVYSLRKRYEWLRFLGSTPGWFRFHMVLGIVGPLCILYHSNFGTGATNSNVALFSMLAVAGSGVIGRYIYAHVHCGVDGRKLELEELRTDAETLRSMSERVSFVPELVKRLESAEQRLLNAGPRLALLGFMTPFLVGLATLRARRQLHHYIRRPLQATSRESAVVRAEEELLCERAHAYVDRRLGATRRVAEYQGYERLFSLWHSIHIPLIFVMVIAAIIHVIAVHVY